MNTAAKVAVMNLKNLSLVISFLPALSAMASKRKNCCPDLAGIVREAVLKAQCLRLLPEVDVLDVRVEIAAAAIDIRPFPTRERFSLFTSRMEEL